ncbi:MAG: hypothetical protein ACI9HA_003357 [Dinoroseobacter sp.]
MQRANLLTFRGSVADEIPNKNSLHYDCDGDIEEVKVIGVRPTDEGFGQFYVLYISNAAFANYFQDSFANFDFAAELDLPDLKESQKVASLIVEGFESVLEDALDNGLV